MNKRTCLGLIALAAVTLGGCGPESGTHGAAADGIVIYYGKIILNNTETNILADRVIQLRAIVLPSGDTVIWSSNNTNAVTVNETGRIRTSATSGRTAVITAESKINPDLRAQVTFHVVDSR
ncbi:MAG: Ig-like domain-containing protein [Treponema sp.]|jgi:hypothetical protein|nr:Ig-like domain-containing protein [Treponema sp.]